jgi:hypothetical protein
MDIRAAASGELLGAAEKGGGGGPFGVGSLAKVLKTLCRLAEEGVGGNGGAAGGDEGLRLLALGLLNVVLESAGHALAQHPPLVAIIRGDMCRVLLQVGGGVLI